MSLPAELKELIALHANTGELGGDLKHDTVAIIGATLDLQEKARLSDEYFAICLTRNLLRSGCPTGHDTD